jgi:DNA invertase Pin-like site-specific DNA recombinase
MYHNYIAELNIRPEDTLVYLRKSRSDDPLLSVEEVLAKHEAMLDEWAEKSFGEKIPDNNKFREVVSGETIADRPEIQKLLRMVESPKYKAILIVEVERLSRGDLEDAGRLIKLLRFTNTLVITPQKIYDLRDEYDRDMFERELKRGNEYLEYTKKIMNRGKMLSVSQGNYIGSEPPYGYDKIWITEGKRKCPSLAINEEQANVVRMIFDLYVNKDMGRPNICHYLDNLGIKPPKGERWSQAALKDMLQNVHYLGKIKWNWRKTVTIVEDGEIIKTNPKSKIGEYLIYEGKHEAIISEELFNAALEKQRRNHRAKATTKISNPFAGLLYCQCGRAMTLRSNMRHGVERGSRRLICDDQTHCHTGSCLFNEMIEQVSDILKQCIADFEIRLKNSDGDSIKLHEKLLKSLEKKMQDLEAKELAQWEAQAHPDESQRMPPHIFKMLNEKLLKEKEEVKEAMCNARKSMPTPIDYEEKLTRFHAALDALHDPEADAARKNKLLKACIERIEYNRQAPERMKRKPGEKKGTTIKTTGGHWIAYPIELDVKLKA